MLDRRQFVAAATAACLAPASAARGQADELPALRDVGAAVGIEVGSAFSLDPDPKYRALLAKHCEVITPEWQMKPPNIKRDAESPYDFSVVDQFAAFCDRNGQKLHGHTLYWAVEPIEWAVGATFEETKRLYGGFIRTVMARYPRIETWDVLNELIDDETDRLRTTYLVGQYGYDFIDFCFRTALEMAPTARLAINDYWIECAAGVCENKRIGVLEMLARLKDRGTPVHAIGIQSHLYSKLPVSPEKTVEFIDSAARLGLEAWVSEMDVNDSDLPDDVATRDAMVADIYERYLTAVLAHPAVKRLVFWGISDYDNWIVQGGSHWAHRTPASSARPCLFDRNNEPKPAFHAVVKALRAAGAR